MNGLCARTNHLVFGGAVVGWPLASPMSFNHYPSMLNYDAPVLFLNATQFDTND
ncbi:MAG: hypothetical protein JWM42_1708 [Burkholderia sp.]|jgi:hypothetical protein|nr:hypothetical protein [Burkholderia sp.]